MTSQAWPQDPGTERPKPFYSDRKRGWYWYEPVCQPGRKLPERAEKKEEAEEKQTKKLPSLSDYTYEQLWNMYPDDFQALLNTLMKKAVQNPTEQNIMDYLVMQDIARRKSAAYAAAVSFVTQKHPELTTADVYPITAPGRASRAQNMETEIDGVLRNSRSQFALIMFIRSGCRFCKAQESILKYFTDRYEWPVRLVDVEQNPNLGARFNVNLVPTMLLVQKGSDKYIPISVGVISYADLKLRLYRSIRYLKGEIRPEQWFMYDFEKGKSTDPLGRLTSQGRSGTHLVADSAPWTGREK